MSRVNVPITALPANAGTAPVAGTGVDLTFGNIIAAGSEHGRLLIVVRNTSAGNRNVTIRAGVNPPAFRAGLGNLVVQVPLTSGERFIVLESARFAQVDGSIHIDLEAGFTGTIACYRLPKDI